MAHVAAIRRAVHETDPTQAVSGVRTLHQDVASVLARPRLYAFLMACFAVIAVTLAAVGVYGLISYLVVQRTHEIGVRLALGATRRDVFLELLGQGMRLVAGGLVVGVVAAFALRQVLSALVFEVSTGDLSTYALAVVTLLAVALVAIIIPAHRGARVQPIAALRCE